MNIYKFDNTIYNGNSIIDFYFFLTKKNPKVIVYLPIQIYSILLYILGVYDRTKLKEKLYIFLRKFKNIDELVEEFWDMNEKKINSWYKSQSSIEDIIVTSAPVFLILPICKRFKLANVVASKVNKITGKYDGKDCYGDEIYNRLELKYKDLYISNFYTSTIEDNLLVSKSIRSYIYEDNKLYNFTDYRIKVTNKIKKIFLAREFMMFLIIGGINTLNGVLFAYLYSIFLNTNIAFIVGYISALFVSYLLNSYMTFKESFSFKRYVKFCISYIPNFIIQNIVVLIVYNGLGFNKLLAFALAAFIGVPVTFLLMKFFAFSKKGEIQTEIK